MRARGRLRERGLPADNSPVSLSPFFAVAAAVVALLAAASIFVIMRARVLRAVTALADVSARNEALEHERQRLVEELRLSSSTDYLTGLLNRRAFAAAALHEIANASRYRRSFALIMFDIDRFRRVNDRYGHHVGDAVIAAIASIAEKEFRAGDLVCRYGGEEFAVFAPECGADDARALTERVRRAIEALEIAGGEGFTVRVSASFGTVAVAGGACADLDEAVRVADEALDQAKAQGRNCAVVRTMETVSPSAT